MSSKKLSSRNSPIAIIGAGITGLSLAHYLAKAGRKVIVFEGEPEPAGLLRSINFNGTYLEKYYHHIFPGFEALLELIDDLELADKLFWRQTKMGFLYNQRVFAFNGPGDLLAFSPLSIASRLRFGISLLKINHMKNWLKLDGFSAEEMLKKYSGKAAWQKIWAPLMKMKFGNDYDKVSATWIWDRIKTRSSSLKSLRSRESLGYLAGGFQNLIQRLVDKVLSSGGEILLSTPISEIEFKDQIINLKYNEKEQFFSQVVSTIPLPNLLKIANSLPADYKENLKRMNYQNVYCCVLRLTKPLSNFYWINLSGQKTHFVALVEHTNLVDRNDYKDESIIYLLRYLSKDDPSFLEEDNLIIQKAYDLLKQNFSHFHQNQVIEAIVFKDKYVQPIFNKGYSELKKKLRSPYKGFFLADSSQIYPASRSINSAINIARSVSEKIIAKTNEI